MNTNVSARVKDFKRTLRENAINLSSCENYRKWHHGPYCGVSVHELVFNSAFSVRYLCHTA